MRRASVSSAHHLSMGVPVPVPAPIIESALFQDSITVKKLRPVKGRSSSLRFTTCYIVPGMARGIPAPVRFQNGIRAVGILSSWMIRFPVTWECRAKATCRDVGRFFVLRPPCGQPPPFRLLPCLLRSDLPCTLTRTGLPPSPARCGFSGNRIRSRKWHPFRNWGNFKDWYNPLVQLLSSSWHFFSDALMI